MHNIILVEKETAMASYVEKQLFKTRFWKHIWNLDPESLRELLDEGNPIGHINFPFRVPSDHGYVFHTAYKGQVYEISKTKDKSASEFRNEAIENYLSSHGKSACDILWKMYSEVEREDLYLPNGVNIDDFCEIREMFSILAKHDPNAMYKSRHVAKWQHCDVSVDISDIFTLRLAFCNFKPEEIFQYGQSANINGFLPKKACYQLMLLYHPKQFNRFVKEYRYPCVFDDLFKWCKASDDVTKKLWKLRLVNLDPERWVPRYDNEHGVFVEGLDGVSVEELKAMYEGHPKNINPHDIDLALSDRPTKKAKQLTTD